MSGNGAATRDTCSKRRKGKATGSAKTIEGFTGNYNWHETIFRRKIDIYIYN